MTTLSGDTGANGRWCVSTMLPPGWNGSSRTQSPIVCSIGSVSIASGATATCDLELFLDVPMPSRKNCALPTWGGQQTGPACVQIFP